MRGYACCGLPSSAPFPTGGTCLRLQAMSQMVGALRARWYWVAAAGVVLVGLLGGAVALAGGPQFRPVALADLAGVPDVSYACWSTVEEQVAPRKVEIEGTLRFYSDGHGLWRIDGDGVDRASSERYDVSCQVSEDLVVHTVKISRRR